MNSRVSIPLLVISLSSKFPCRGMAHTGIGLQISANASVRSQKLSDGPTGEPGRFLLSLKLGGRPKLHQRSLPMRRALRRPISGLAPWPKPRNVDDVAGSAATVGMPAGVTKLAIDPGRFT